MRDGEQMFETQSAELEKVLSSFEEGCYGMGEHTPAEAEKLCSVGDF